MGIRKDNSKLYLKILSAFTFFAAAVTVTALFILPSLYEKECKTRINEELEEKLNGEILTSNIRVIQRKSKIIGDREEITFSAGASGVIFEKDAGVYYALTAYHVVSDGDENTKFLIQPYTAPSFSEYTDTVSEYYKQFPAARVEYYSEEYDLAVLSFPSAQRLGTVNIAEKNAEKDAEVAVISNPEGKSFVHTFGNVLSNDMTFFSGGGAKSSYIIKHSAYIAPGSSGSAVLAFNGENVEAVGVNIGGGTDFMGRFGYGAMVPCQHVRIFLNCWKAGGF